MYLAVWNFNLGFLTSVCATNHLFLANTELVGGILNRLS